MSKFLASRVARILPDRVQILGIPRTRILPDRVKILWIPRARILPDRVQSPGRPRARILQTAPKCEASLVQELSLVQEFCQTVLNFLASCVARILLGRAQILGTPRARILPDRV